MARGHQQAFAQLYDRFADRVYGLVRRVRHDPAQSEEVAQEVFVRVWRQAHRYDTAKGRATAWLMMFAHRRAVDHVRSEHAARTRDDHIGQLERLPAFDPPAETVETVETVETSLGHEQVRAALDQLTDVQREAIELAYYDANAYREVAELLDAAWKHQGEAARRAHPTA